MNYEFSGMRPYPPSSYARPSIRLDGSALSNFSVSTLGPEGTCSHDAALYSGAKEINLRASFEDAIEDVVRGEVDLAFVPAAYCNFNKIVFGFLGQVEIAASFITVSPSFVLVGRSDGVTNSTSATTILSSHHAPLALARQIHFPFTVLDARSNVDAAYAVIDGKADYAITQKSALSQIESNQDAGAPLTTIDEYGPVPMLWAVFRKLNLQ